MADSFSAPLRAPSPSLDYHDFVIKDGQFIGDFEGMYRSCEDPWRQTTVTSPLHALALGRFRRLRPERTLDIGSGLGAFSAAIAAATGGDVVGVDVSPTACARASAAHPNLRFVTMDVRAPAFAEGTFDAVLASEIVWYVLRDLRLVFETVTSLLKPGGTLVVLQQFYAAGKQRYGTEILREPGDLPRFIPLPTTELIVSPARGDPKCLLVAKKEPAAADARCGAG